MLWAVVGCGVLRITAGAAAGCCGVMRVVVGLSGLVGCCGGLTVANSAAGALPATNGVKDGRYEQTRLHCGHAPQILRDQVNILIDADKSKLVGCQTKPNANIQYNPLRIPCYRIHFISVKYLHRRQRVLFDCDSKFG